jgi:hypothetical protein
MPAPYLDRYALTQDDMFIRRVQMAIVKAATDVKGEATPTVARTLLADKVLQNPSGWAKVMANGVATTANVGLGGADDPSVSGSDDALQFVVNSLWDDYASENLA